MHLMELCTVCMCNVLMELNLMRFVEKIEEVEN